MQLSDGTVERTAAALEKEAAMPTAAANTNTAFLMEIIFSLSKLDNGRVSHQKAAVQAMPARQAQKNISIKISNLLP